MGASHLRKFIDETPPRDFEQWYYKQDAIVSICRLWMRRKIGNGFAVPEGNEEIIDETIDRVLRSLKRYKWDRVCSFDEFFAKCLFTTMNSLWAKQRTHVLRNISLTSEHLKSHELRNQVEPTQEDQLARKQWRAAETVKAKTGMRGKIIEYIENLPRFAEQGDSTSEIARQLKVKPSSLGSFRARVRRILVESSKK